MSAPTTETTEYIVKGANCSVCLNATLDALRAQPSVVDAHLSATDHCIRIEHDGSETDRYLEIVRTTLHGVVKYGNEIRMVEVDPELAELHCTHH